MPVAQRDQYLNQRFEQSTLGLLNQNIRTYVVGYNYDNDTSGLDARAVNGGTRRDHYTYVGDEEELDRAFESIIRDMKACRGLTFTRVVPDIARDYSHGRRH